MELEGSITATAPGDGVIAESSAVVMAGSATASEALAWAAPWAPRRDLLRTRRRAIRQLALAGADVLALVIAWSVLALTRTPGSDEHLWVLALVPVGWLALTRLMGLYDRDAKVVNSSTIDELPKLLHSLALGTLLCFLIVPPAADIAISRGELVLFYAVVLASTLVLRTAARAVSRHSTTPERVLIVGSGTVATMVARKLNAHPSFGVELVGRVDVTDHEPLGGPAGLDWLGTTEDLATVCREHRVERVVIAFSALSHEALIDVVRQCRGQRTAISIVPRLFEVLGRSFEVDEIEGLTLLGVGGLSRGRGALAVKRSIDLAASLFGLLVLTPVFALIALAIKLSSPGPVFYVQRRIGRDNEPFAMFKFRTMVDGADAMKADLAHLNEVDSVMFKIAADPRVTRIGRFLRRTSLDELPQLLNVVRGEMSLVGPRPLVPSENAHVLGWHRARLDLTPGLTGPWQVMGRTAIPFDEMVKMDCLYVAEWSLWSDIRLLLRTAPVVLFGRGQ